VNGKRYFTSQSMVKSSPAKHLRSKIFKLFQMYFSELEIKTVGTPTVFSDVAGRPAVAAFYLRKVALFQARPELKQAKAI
jgi:hypothetical protein